MVLTRNIVLQELVVPLEAVGFHLAVCYTPVRSDGEVGKPVLVMTPGMTPSMTPSTLAFSELACMRDTYDAKLPPSARPSLQCFPPQSPPSV